MIKFKRYSFHGAIVRSDSIGAWAIFDVSMHEPRIQCFLTADVPGYEMQLENYKKQGFGVCTLDGEIFIRENKKMISGDDIVEKLSPVLDKKVVDVVLRKLGFMAFILLALSGCSKNDPRQIYEFTCTEADTKRVQSEAEYCRSSGSYSANWCYQSAMNRICKVKNND